MTLWEKVEKALDTVRPNLQADGGNVELIDVNDEEGVVKVKLVGTCCGCHMAAITLENGIINAIKQFVPEIKEVLAV
ncbi:MAG: NifU family protein [Endomicrobium sp.]|jgi:Fe-S cluster biogenesis protein NfuA|nr:NifU family protein [Endomicrobium sp.]